MFQRHFAFYIVYERILSAFERTTMDCDVMMNVSTSINLADDDVSSRLQKPPFIQPVTIADIPPNFSSQLYAIETRKKHIIILSESSPKRQKVENENCVKRLFISSQRAILNRLNIIEEKVDRLSYRCRLLEEKVKNAISKSTAVCEFQSENISRVNAAKTSAPVEQQYIEGKSNSQLLSLNSEAYPDGSWLGNPNNPDGRVRCEISPSDLSFLNVSCTTPEKMALTLLDYLFDRETQANSNISGSGKHGKAKLNPLKVYGIRCHLAYMFGITEEHWQRVKRNLDSKCRTAFRRKRQGMSMSVKSFTKKVTSEAQHIVSTTEISTESNSGSPSLVSFNEQLMSVQITTKCPLRKLHWEQVVGEVPESINNGNTSA